MPSTAQQVNTLLYYLQTKQTPPFDVLFWSALQKIDFDYSEQSIEMLARFFGAMAKRNYQLSDLLQQTGGQAFVLSIAGYVATYLAKMTDEPITWLDFSQLQQDIVSQNQPHIHTTLPAVFEYSLTAKIGKQVNCQPLKLLPSLLQGEDVLKPFVQEMTKAIFEHAQVNLIAEPNEICQQYLKKVQTGRLLDNSIGFYHYLKDINFDYSMASLLSIDEALDRIAQDCVMNKQDYVAFVNQQSNQAFCYLLGFYIGITSSRLANTAVKWVNYEQMHDSLGDEFDHCIEHQFVLLMEDGYRTPMLVMTNRLFGLAANFPTTASDFAKILIQQNAGDIKVFPYLAKSESTHQTIHPHWLQAMQAAGALLAYQLQSLARQQQVQPSFFEAAIPDPSRISQPSDGIEHANIQTITTADTDMAIDGLYQLLATNPKLSPYIVACYDSFVNLPIGRTDGLVIVVQVYDAPPLQLQFILPYQLTQDDRGMVIYPLVSNQPFMANTAQNSSEWSADVINELVQILYQACITAHTKLAAMPMGKIWQDYFVNRLDLSVKTPKQLVEQKLQYQLVDQIDLAVLPLSPQTMGNDSNHQQNTVPPFDYETINWRGFDLAKYILQTPSEQRDYLQVFAPDRLISDELFTQAEATDRLYHFGKVVWGVVIEQDNALSQPITDEERDKPFAVNNLHTAEILFDPSGQASVHDLQQKAHALRQMIEPTSIESASDVAFYRMHLQDQHSRLFNYAYPQSLAATNFRLSSTWVWRRHLPNGMLSSPVVPIIIDSQNQGQIMILPSKFWDKSYYDYWLSLAYAAFGQDYDLMPYLQWQQRQSISQTNKAWQGRLFPKFKTPIPSSTKSSTAITQPSNSHEGRMTVTTNLTTQNKDIHHAVPQQTTITTDILAKSQSEKTTAQHSNMAQDTPRPLTLELQQQLLQDKQRLQTQLSTQDQQKEKKLYLILVAVISLIAITIMMIRVLK